MNNFIETSGIMYSVERNFQIVSSFKGLINRSKDSGKRYIGFHPNTDIQVGDWLINPQGDRYYVDDKETASFRGSPHELRCFVKSQAEYNKSATATTVFNIGTATGSVIGTQSSVTLNYNTSIQQIKDQVDTCSSPDKEELQQLISLLEMIVEDRLPVQKGILSKFSAVMERNSWITSSIASTLLSWLMTQIH